MTHSPDLEQRLAYLGLDEQEVALLAELRPMLEKHADAFVAQFYRHLLSFAPTRALLRDPAVKERLLAKQREYLLSLASPRFVRPSVREVASSVGSVVVRDSKPAEEIRFDAGRSIEPVRPTLYPHHDDSQTKNSYNSNTGRTR